MYKKSLFPKISFAVIFIAMLVIFLGGAVMMFTARGTCIAMQTRCGGARSSACEIWNVNGTIPVFSSDIKTCEKVEGLFFIKEKECPIPTEEECKIYIGD